MRCSEAIIEESKLKQGELPINCIIHGDVLSTLKKLPSDSVDCIVTSPPYWGMRDYNVDGQIGLEPTLEEYLDKLLEVTKELKRVLKPTGVMFWNHGDSYGSNSGRGGSGNVGATKAQIKFNKRGVKSKCLVLQGVRLALRMIDEQGWILRNDIIWYKCLSGNTPIFAKSNGRYLRTTIRELYRLINEGSDVQLPSINSKWQNVKSMWYSGKQRVYRIKLRSGFEITATANHRFLTESGLKYTSELTVGDVLMNEQISIESAAHKLTYDLGWVVGLFLAEGSYQRSNEIRFSLHSKEKHFAERIRSLFEPLGARVRIYEYDNSLAVIVSSYIARAYIKEFIAGEGSKKKHLSRSAFNTNRDFLGGIVDGWLDGDGYYDSRNNRYRFRIGYNRELIEDMRTVCNVLGYKFSSKVRWAKYQNGKKLLAHEVEIRKTPTTHFNTKNNGEVIKIHPLPSPQDVYDLEVEGNHLFLLPDGTVSHNSNHMPESVKDRFTKAYEHVFMFVKNEKYWFDLDAVREPHSEATIKRQKYSWDLENAKWAKANVGGSPVSTKHNPYGSPHPLGKNPGDVWVINTKPFPEAHFACVDEETEVLTESGWKRWDEVSLNDKIATFDILNETIHYHKPYNIYIFKYDGKLIVIENQWIAQYVTPNHRVLLKYVHSAKKREPDEHWHYVNAEKIRPYSGILIPLSGKYDGKYSIGKRKAELLGWIIGDGYIDKNRQVFIYQSQSANADKVKRIENLLKSCGIVYSKYLRDREYKTKISTEVTIRFSKKHEETWKWIFNWLDITKRPKWKLLHLKHDELRALYNGLILSDGHKRLDGRHALIQKDEYIREWFRVLCVHLGLRTTETKCSRVSTAPTVFVTMKNYAQIHQSDFKKCIKRIPYRGIVWCPHVPNTNFIARRKGSNGKYRIFITGNTFPPSLVKRCILAGCPEWICKKCGEPRRRVVKSIGKERVSWGVDRKARILGELGKPAMRNIWVTTGWTDCGCDAGWESGIVLDPFIGSGTTALVALKHARRFIGIELNREYCEMAYRRIEPWLKQQRLEVWV